MSLGCQVDTLLCGDYHSVKWYKEGARVGVISHDFRCENKSRSTDHNFLMSGKLRPASSRG